MSRFPVRYDRATSDSRGPTPGAKALLDWILATTPHTTNLGIYNYRPVRGGGTLSVHAEGRAIDVGTPDPLAQAAVDDLLPLLVEHHADLGLQLAIWRRRVWSNTRQGEGWRPYTGTDPHTGHTHLELTRAAAAALTPSMIADTLGGTMSATLTDDQIRAIQRAIAAGGHARAWWHDGKPPIAPENTGAIDRYVDGDFGRTTSEDLMTALAASGSTPPPDDGLVAKAETLARVQAAWQVLDLELGTIDQ